MDPDDVSGKRDCEVTAPFPLKIGTELVPTILKPKMKFSMWQMHIFDFIQLFLFAGSLKIP